MNIIKRLNWALTCEKLENQINALNEISNNISKEFFYFLGNDFEIMLYGLRKKVMRVYENYTEKNKEQFKIMLDKYATAIINFVNNNGNQNFKIKAEKLLAKETDENTKRAIKYDAKMYKRAVISNKTKFNRFMEIYNKLNEYCGFFKENSELEAVVNQIND